MHVMLGLPARAEPLPHSQNAKDLETRSLVFLEETAVTQKPPSSFYFTSALSLGPRTPTTQPWEHQLLECVLTITATAGNLRRFNALC